MHTRRDFGKISLAHRRQARLAAYPAALKVRRTTGFATFEEEQYCKEALA
jgi:hypothetical protein